MKPATAGLVAIMSGSAGGQILMAAAAPLLSRIYEPADFGIFTIISAISAITGTVAVLRFELAVPLPEREQDAHSIVILGFASAMIMAILSTVAVLLLGNPLVEWLNMPELAPWLYAVPVMASAIGITALLNQFAIRRHRFRAVGRRALLQSATMTSVQVTGGLLTAGAGGLTAGYAMAQAAGAISLLRGSGFWHEATRKAASPSRLRKVLSQHSRFPILLAPAGLINIAGSQLPLIVFAFYFGAEFAGWLSFSQRILALPVALIGTAIAQVYLAHFAVASRTNRSACREMFVRASAKLAIAGTAVAVVLVIFAPAAFRLTFGDSWENSGQYGRALALGLAAQFVAAPLSQTLIVLGRELTQCLWDCIRFITAVGSIVIPAQLGLSPAVAVWALGVTSAACYAALWCLAYLATKQVPTIPRSRTGSASPDARLIEHAADNRKA